MAEPDLFGHGEPYVDPIVDHGEERHEALARYEETRS
jgi:deoxyribodipyrimidine photolyase